VSYPEGVNAVNTLYTWTDWALIYGLLALRTWALIDCLTRKMAAFPAVDKLTKPAWVAMLLIGDLLGYLLSASQPVGIFALLTTVLASVYLADVRPAVREVSEGR
jgi:hypothetical protein